MIFPRFNNIITQLYLYCAIKHNLSDQVNGSIYHCWDPVPENPPLQEIWAIKWENRNRISTNLKKIFDQVSDVKSIQNMLEI